MAEEHPIVLIFILLQQFIHGDRGLVAMGVDVSMAVVAFYYISPQL